MYVVTTCCAVLLPNVTSAKSFDVAAVKVYAPTLVGVNTVVHTSDPPTGKLATGELGTQLVFSSITACWRAHTLPGAHVPKASTIALGEHRALTAGCGPLLVQVLTKVTGWFSGAVSGPVITTAMSVSKDVDSVVVTVLLPVLGS